MKHFYMILMALALVLLSCEKNPADAIQGKSTINEYLNLHLTGTWKVDGLPQGSVLWQFLAYNDSLCDYYVNSKYNKDSIFLIQEYDDYKPYLADYYINDSLSCMFFSEISLSIKIHSINTWSGKYNDHDGTYDIVGTLIE